MILNFAEVGLYSPKWTDQIQNEWIRNLLQNRQDLTAKQLDRTKLAMNNAFADAEIKNYQLLIDSLKLPDEDDRHVLAAAIKIKADFIVTDNLKDFPKKYLQNFDIEVQSSDTFVSNIIDLSPNKAFKAFENQVKSLKNPTKTLDEVLSSLKNCGLKKSVKLLQQLE